MGYSSFVVRHGRARVVALVGLVSACLLSAGLTMMASNGAFGQQSGSKDPGNPKRADESSAGRRVAVSSSPTPDGQVSGVPSGNGPASWVGKTDPDSLAKAAAKAKDEQARALVERRADFDEKNLSPEERAARIRDRYERNPSKVGSASTKSSKSTESVDLDDLLAIPTKARTAGKGTEVAVEEQPGSAGAPTNAAANTATTAQKKSNGRKTRVKRTDEGLRFDNPDGTTTAIIRVDNQGKPLVGKRTQLAPLVDGPGEIRATISPSSSVRLAGSDDAEGPINLSVGDQTISLRPIGGGASKPVRQADSTVRFGNAFADGDLVEEVATDGLRGYIQLSKVPKKGVWAFQIILSDGLRAIQGFGDEKSAEVGAPIVIVDRSGKQVAMIPSGLAFDANGAMAPSDMVLRSKGGKSIVTVTVDDNWLRASDRAYPVVVDPSVSIGWGSLNDAATVNNVNPSSVDNSYWMMLSKNYWSWGTAYGYLRFDTSLVPAGATVTSAVLAAFVRHCDAPYVPSPYTFGLLAEPLSSGYSPYSVTWNSQPGVYPESRFARATSATQFVGFDVTSWANNWSQGIWANNGIRLRMEDTTQPAYCVVLSGSPEYQTIPWVSNTYLSITYTTNRKPTVDLVAPTADWSNYMAQVDGSKAIPLGGDFNGDAQGDMAIFYDYGNSDTGIFAYKSANGMPKQFQPLWTSGAGTFGWGSSKPFTGDFNGDGKADVGVLYNQGSQTSSLFRFTTNSSGSAMTANHDWSSSPSIFAAENSKPFGGDFNGDGKTDVGILYNYGNNTTALFVSLTTAAGVLTAPVQVWNSGPGNFSWDASKPFVADFNGDKKSDVGILYNYGNNNTSLFSFVTPATGLAPIGSQIWNSGPGNFSWDSSKPFGGDFNGDGRTDVGILYNYGNSNTSLFIFTTSATGTIPTYVQTWNSGAGNFSWDASTPFVSDFNGDKKADVGILYNYGGPNQTALFVSVGTGTALPGGPQPAGLSTSNRPTFTVNASDPDGDTLNYRFETCSPNFASCTAYKDSGTIGNFSWTPPNDLPYGTQQWRASVFDGSVWVSSAPRSITIVKPNSAPPYPTRVSPADMTQTYAGPYPLASALELEVDTAGIAGLQYNFKFCSATWNTGCVQSGWITNKKWKPPTVVSGTKYTWNASVRNVPTTATEEVVEVQAQSFWTVQVLREGNTYPVAPPAINPAKTADNASGVVRNSTLGAAGLTDAQGDPVEYQFEVCTPSLTGTCQTSTWNTSVEFSPLLTYGLKYEWHVKARERPTNNWISPVGLPTNWSPTYTFTVAVDPQVAATLNPLAPANGERTTPKPILQASAVGANSATILYQYQICAPALPPLTATTTPSSAHCLESPWVPGYWQPTTELYANETYTWRAFARNAATGSTSVASTWTRTLRTELPLANDQSPFAGGYSPYVEYTESGDDGGSIGGGQGQFVYSATDISIATAGPTLGISRHYDSRRQRTDTTGVGAASFGIGWRSNLELGLTLTTSGSAIVYLPDGRLEYHNKNPDGLYATNPGFWGDLTANGSAGFIYTTKERTKFFVNSAGRLDRYVDKNGTALVYSYDANNRVASITEPLSGRGLTFGYWPDGHVKTVSTASIAAHGNTPIEWQYAYTGNFLTQVCPPPVTGASGCFAYQYTNYTNGRLNKVIKPKGNTDVEIGYDDNGFTLLTPNLLAGGNPSFEQPTMTNWSTSGAGPGSGALLVSDARFEKNILRLKYAGAPGGTTKTEYTVPIAAEGSKTYTLAAWIKGASTGGVCVNWMAFDAFNNLIEGGCVATGGSMYTKTAPVWQQIRSRFLTPSNTKTIRFGFNWYATEGNNGDVDIDGVMLEKGDGLTGRVRSRTDGMGNTTSFIYDWNGPNLITKITSPRPNIVATQDEYNEQYKLVKHTDAVGRITTYTYDANGFVDSITAPGNRKTTLENDKRGNVLKRTSPTGLVEYWTYSTNTSLVATYRDARSASATDDTYKTTYGYDGPGNKTSETNPAGSRTWTYTDGTEATFNGIGTMPKGLLKQYVDRTSRQTNYLYDSFGNLRRTVDPANGVQRSEYDEIGRAKTRWRELNGAQVALEALEYNKRSLVEKITGPVVLNALSNVSHQAVVTTSYDANGNPFLVKTTDLVGGDPARSVRTEYDNNDRAWSVTASPGSADAGTVTTEFDQVGNVVLSTDARGVKTKTYYDYRNLPEKIEILNYFDEPGAATSQFTVKSATYDEIGRVDTETDALLHVVKYTYDETNRTVTTRLLNYRNPDGSTRDVTLSVKTTDKVGNETMIVSGSAVATGLRKVQQVWDARGYLTDQIIDPDGLKQKTTFTYDAEGRKTSRTAGTAKESWTYNPTSKLLESHSNFTGTGATEKDQNLTTSWTYDPLGRMESEKSPTGYFTNFEYDALDRRVRTISPAPQTWDTTGSTKAAGTRPETRAGYNTFGEETHSKDERAGITVVMFDSRGRAKSKTSPTVGTLTPVASWTYDAAGNTMTATDPRGSITDYKYTAFGKVRSIISPAIPATPPATGLVRPTTTYTYDRAGQLTSTIAPDGTTTTQIYDDMSRVRQVVSPGGQSGPTVTMTYDYNDVGNQVSVTDPLGNLTKTAYNQAGQLESTTDPTGAMTKIEYEDQTGFPRANSLYPSGSTTWVRRTEFDPDRAGRVLMQRTMMTAPDTTNIETKFVYDQAGNIREQTRPNGATDKFEYDEIGRLIQSTIKLTATEDAVTKAGYDAAGNLTKIFDPRGNVTEMGYNAWGLLTSTLEPATTAHPAETDRKWTVGYNAAGLPDSETRPGGINVTRVFDALGRMKSESASGSTAAAATRSFEYDNMNRVKTAGTQSFGWDNRGLLTGSSGPQGTSTFTYDAGGNMKTRTDTAGAASFNWTKRGELESFTVGGQTVSLKWTPPGQVETINYPNSVTRSFIYDAAGRLKDDHVRTSAGTTLTRRQSEFYPDGSPKATTITQPGNTAAGVTNYLYDLGGRLRSESTTTGTTTYDWDRAGNRTSVNGVVSVYDQRNRLSSTNNGATTYNWTARGTLTSITGTGAATYGFDALDRMTTAAGVTYTYDSLDRVATRTAGTTSTAMSYAGMEKDPVAESAAGVIQTAYWRSPTGAPLAQTRAGSTVLLGADRHGDVAWSLSATGTITDSIIRSAFGTTRAATGTPSALGFQGDWTDPTNGLVWMAARWYNPTTGTFTSRDTYPGRVGAAATLNRYLYALGNPLAYTDPTGHYSDGLDFGAEAMRLFGELASIIAAQLAQSVSDQLGHSWIDDAVAMGVSAQALSNAEDLHFNSTTWNATPIQLAIPTTPTAPSYAIDPFSQVVTARLGNLTSTQTARSVYFEYAYRDIGATKASDDVKLDMLAASFQFAFSGEQVSRSAFGKEGKDFLASYEKTVTDQLVHNEGSLKNGMFAVARAEHQDLCFGFQTSCDAAYSQYKATGKSSLSVGLTYCLLNKAKCDKDRNWTTGAIALAFVVGLYAPVVKDYVLENRNSSSKPGGGCGNSFTAETLVLMADGSLKPIKDVVVGDKVVATNPETRAVTVRNVTDTWLNLDDDLLDVAVLSLSGVETIHTTEHHRFWNHTLKKWVNAVDLHEADQLFTADGDLATVGKLTRVPGVAPMFDLTVDTDHTFYIALKSTSVLVHNQSHCGRDAEGKFTNGNSGMGKAAEEAGLVDFAAETGLSVARNQVRASVPGVKNGRYYDGLALQPDGTYIGIEVKSGSASRSPGQRAFDSAVSSSNPATAKLNGKTIQITEVRLINK